MFYVIEQNTDMQDPRTVVRKLSSRAQAEELAKVSNLGFAFPGAAHDGALGGSNYHHRLREVYQIVGIRPPSNTALRKEAQAISTRNYPCSSEDALADWVRRMGDRIESEKAD